MVNSQQQNDIEMIVSEAKRVITPLSPISIFAARNPWEGLENQTFNEVATWLKDIRDVDMYPNYNAIEDAKAHGEIDIDMSLLEWDVDRGHIEEVGSKFFEDSAY